MKPHAHLTQDSRYKKKSSTTYPIRLVVTFERNGKTVQKYLPTGHSFTKPEWKKMTGKRPGDDFRNEFMELTTVKDKANGMIRQMHPFEYERFLAKFAGEAVKNGSLEEAFKEYMVILKQKDRVGTASAYSCANVSLQSFAKDQNLTLMIGGITKATLEAYQAWMQENGKSWTTIGMYLRCVRALINRAINAQEIPSEAMAFGTGEKKFQIATEKGTKEKLDPHEIGALLGFRSDRKELMQSKDLFVFSLWGNGMNVKDICQLKYQNVQGSNLFFRRAKTFGKKLDKTQITVELRPIMQDIINRHGNPARTPETYIFPILSPGLPALEQKRLKDQLIKKMNVHLEIIAKECGIEKNLTTMVARHSFATLLMHDNRSAEQIRDLLGHTDIKTTQNYLARLKPGVVRELTSALDTIEQKAKRTVA